jgi:hypothetical protein
MDPYAPVAQLDRALPSEGKGHTFESCRVRQDSGRLLAVEVQCNATFDARQGTSDPESRCTLTTHELTFD